MSVQTSPVALARQILSAASLPVIDGEPLEDSRGYQLRENSDGTVTVCPVLDGRPGAPANPVFRGGSMSEWRAMNRAALDAVTAEGWERTGDTWDGNVFRAPAGPLAPMVKETIHVLERDGQPGYARFDVSPYMGAVSIDVAGGWNCRELSISDVALPALHAAGFDVSTVHEGEGAERREWGTLHHLVVRPPVERREEWALAHTVRRLLQSKHTHVGWNVHMKPALPERLPEDAAPDAHRGALFFRFDGHAVHGPRDFDHTLQDAGYVLGPSRHEWWRNVRILRPAAP
ncbi:hypothetical protein [Streptomyces tirandamycinicus]|uniref:Uncharacterized protein n=1 Tax=Streptomyces tirandamycinicus TaxID=2174846 RepID=A0A2S1T1W8_9ACTN|nr:hypothetical protein [Streptomyces tirandamycinicus]AWI32648.1 hypothetical protein DDW44_30480 [Streptomyces tirandamycinicus]